MARLIEWLQRSKFVRWMAIALLTSSLVVALGWRGEVRSPLSLSPVAAQVPPTFSFNNAVPLIYEQVPFLPLENQYRDGDGNPAPESTLLSRMIRYHISVQRRIPYFRLDWKLTMADYLGVNEPIYAESYPNANVLQENPREGDMAAVQQLSRAQRDELIDVIVLRFNPLASDLGVTTSPANFPDETPPIIAPSPSPTPASRLREPRPGDAQLLLP